MATKKIAQLVLKPHLQLRADELPYFKIMAPALEEVLITLRRLHVARPSKEMSGVIATLLDEALPLIVTQTQLLAEYEAKVAQAVQPEVQS